MARPRLFTKRHPDANGTAAAPAPPVPPPPDLTLPALQRELADCRAKVRELAAERETLALRSLEGDADATARIEEIDALRLQLVALDETYNSAIRELSKQKKDEREDGWRKRLPHLQKVFAFELRMAWVGARDDIGRNLHDGIDPRQALRQIEELELKIARQVASEQLPPLIVPYGNSNADHGERERLQAGRKALIEEIADALLASAGKRPDSLEKMITAARDRVQDRENEMAEATKARTALRIETARVVTHSGKIDG